LRVRAEEARAIVGERVYRTWLLYLTSSAVAFETGSIGLYQVLLGKHGDRAGGLAPSTREDLYLGGSGRPPSPPADAPPA
jgi:hypothetical protein